MIKISIDLRKIDQSKCKAHQNGAKYCEIILMDRSDSYGNDYMVVQGVSKEDRDAGVKGAILGNGKNMGGQRLAQSAPASRPPSRESAPPIAPDEVPF